jgi:hypothetical protein
MTAAALIDELALPPDSRVDQRVPKKLLAEQGAPTPADKRAIQDGIEELFWVAALKPSTIGVPLYRDNVREYLEISVLTAVLRPSAKAGRLIELIHRAIPYPVALVTSHGSAVSFSVAHKRFSEGMKGQVVAEDLLQTAVSHAAARTPAEADFLASLALALQPRSDLFAFYQGWCDRVAALEVSRLTGSFVLYPPSRRAAERPAALAEHARLQREIATLRGQASREKQLARRVELNVQVKQLEATLAELTKTL